MKDNIRREMRIYDLLGRSLGIPNVRWFTDCDEDGYRYIAMDYAGCDLNIVLQNLPPGYFCPQLVAAIAGAMVRRQTFKRSGTFHLSFVRFIA